MVVVAGFSTGPRRPGQGRSIRAEQGNRAQQQPEDDALRGRGPYASRAELLERFELFMFAYTHAVDPSPGSVDKACFLLKCDVMALP
eukprot:2625832-Rhodomonas_salina.4